MRLREAIVFAVATVGITLAIACTEHAAAPSPVVPTARAPAAGDMPSEQRFLREVNRSMGVRDGFATLREPAFRRAADVPRMSPTEQVVGVDLGTSQVAYAVNYLNHHEIVEHTIDGIDLLATW